MTATTAGSGARGHEKRCPGNALTTGFDGDATMGFVGAMRMGFVGATTICPGNAEPFVTP
jgi:hypothetical protein